MNLTEILSLDSLKIGYVSGRHENVLLPPLNACANKGELIAVIGRNGIGKSTLLRTLTGLQPSLGGEIFYSGKNIRDYSRMDLAQKVGYISTEIVKVSNMSVYDLVALGRFPHTNWMGKIDTKNHEVIMDAIEKTTMSAFCNRFVSELSDGERQRAMIARILAQDTGIMVMDEPTAFLDIGSKYEILHLMHLLSHKNEKTIIFSTHDLHMAISQSDKIWLILDNRLMEGAPEDIMIEGAFDHLFDSSPVQFNSENGTFSFRSEEKGRIFIEGDGIRRHWTEKAINRAGFSLSEVKTIPYIIIPSGNNREWKLTTNISSVEFRSIYELVSFLSKEDTLSI
ncbi:MAG: ABC transporter ATP-binding protein [Bacteroidales bacterium]|nr:ABC transporter ATP-binding protein [Bacteroidales bacterium]MDP3002073.1 ABC transporter ATP-binding protein [Bacteroidales bacterium]